MIIFINEEKQQTEHSSLEAILEQFGFQQDWVASAVNGQVVPASSRKTFIIKEGDKIEILSPMQGG